jgi:hypothetical protein
LDKLAFVKDFLEQRSHTITGSIIFQQIPV